MNAAAQASAWPSLIEALIGMLSLVLTGVGIPMIRRYLEQQGIQVSREREAVIEKAVKGAIGFAEEWAYQLALDRGDPEARNRMAAKSIEYVGKSIKQTLIDMNLSSADIERLIYSRMPTPQGLPPGFIVPAAPATGPLAPISPRPNITPDPRTTLQS